MGHQIVFVRTAHRDFVEPDADTGLSVLGRDQAQFLLSLYKNGVLPASTNFWCSPKRRAVETLEPLSLATHCHLHVERLLDARGVFETEKALRSRIRIIMTRAAAYDDLIYLCTHGEILAVATEILSGTRIEIPHGQTIIFTKRPKGYRATFPPLESGSSTTDLAERV
jgi:hypothetical protein